MNLYIAYLNKLSTENISHIEHIIEYKLINSAGFQLEISGQKYYLHDGLHYKHNEFLIIDIDSEFGHFSTAQKFKNYIKQYIMDEKLNELI